MLKYVSIERWVDLLNGHLYNPGDPFPYNGKEVPAERIAELSGSQNKAGFALIKAVEEEKPEPIKEQEVPKRATKSRKKAD